MTNPINDARAAVDEMSRKHRHAAIPMLIGACVEWAVEHGGDDIMRGTLLNAVALIDDLKAERRRVAQ